MSDAPVSRVSVRILEKDYQFTCAPDERSALLDSAEYLNTEMRKIRDTGKVIGLDRIAVMAALNMANELLKARARDAALDTGVVQKLRHLRDQVDAALERGQQLDL
jgi:cell division protein ZapA